MKNKRHFVKSISFSLLIFSLFFSIACNREKNAQDLPNTLNAYVYGFTSGIISKATPIKVRFASPLIEENEVGATLSNAPISFSPSVKGTFSWEDRQTLIFEPEHHFSSGTAYVATVYLKKIMADVPKDAQTFEFDFRTKDQFFEVAFIGLRAPNPNDLTNQELTGQLRTSDVASTEEVEKVLKATQDNKTLPINWQHDGTQLVHEFFISNVSRGDAPSNIQVTWNGSPLNISLKGEKAVEVPSLSDFKVTDATIMQGDAQFIMVNFSDPLQESQNLDGLVSLSNYTGNFRFTIEGNQLRIYPSGRLTGEHKLFINPGIRNVNKNRMLNSSEWFVQFEEAQPQVRLLGQGVILPESDGLVFPFEAVGLRAVEVEVFKIFHNNILQFLQTNELDGSSQLYRVGQIVMQKMIPLDNLNPNASSSSWTRYALDLGKLIDQDPEAIYQVRIGFRQSYATYHCGTGKEEQNELALTVNYQDEEAEIESIMDGWYGIDGYYDGYNWNHREDPCYSAYYNSERFIRRNVIASNLGIIAKAGNDKSYSVTISDLRTAQPISGANIEFYDFQQQLITTAQTNVQGMAQVKFEKPPFVLIANYNNERGYLRMQDGNALSLSRFDISGAVTQAGLKGFLYAERGVWRPGDSVFLNFILEDLQGNLPSNYPILFELYDPKGQLQEKRTTSDQVNNVYPLHFATGPDAPTGSWRANIKAGGAHFNKVIRIETIKPNRLKIDLDLGGEELSVAMEPIQAKLQVNWLHGAPGSNLKAQVDVQLSAINTTFPKYQGYEFDDPARSFEAEPKAIFDGQVDADGKASFSAKLTDKTLFPGKLKASFKTRAFENSGEFSTDNFSIQYHPFEAYAGTSIPADKYGQKRLEIGEKESLQFVCVDNKGEPLANRSLRVGLSRVNWRWWWDRGNDNVSRYNTSNHFDALQTVTLTTNAQGQINWDLEVAEWGRYLVRVCDTESGHCSGDFFYAGYPWYGEDNDQFREAAAMLTFTSDKQSYNVGETVKLNIPTGEVGRALITLENGTKVLQSFWEASTSGENTFSFQTTAEMAPTVYAHVALIQPHAQAKNDLPIRMYGVIPIKVENPETRLSPQIAMPEELQPEKEFTVEVAETNGKPMAYTLAVVDEGLLGLTRYKTPNPWDAFYAREALGVRTWDVYDQVLGAYGGELERILSIGGDGEVNPEPADERANRFKPVVMHLGPFYLAKGKKDRHKITLPNYIGAVRTMVVAAKDGAYGKVGKSTPVRKPLMVLATLPRVLGPGESFKLPVNVFAMDAKVKNVSVEVTESSGLVKLVGDSKQNIKFNKPGDQLVWFDVTVGEAIGVARFSIKANGNGESASQEIEIQVRNPNPVVSQVHQKVLQSGEDWEQEFSAVGMFGTNEGILEISSIPPINLGERLKYLIRYPYGCLEQTISGGFPQLYVNKLMELNETQKDQIPKNITAAINRLKLFQTSEGGFTYWPGNDSPSRWSTTYAGHFLLEAKALGYTVPNNLLSRWVSFQKKVAKKWDPGERKLHYYSKESHQLDQAYRLYTLALAKEPDLAAMNRLRETKDLSLSTKWRLAAAYAEAGKVEVAKQLIQNLGTEVGDYQELSYTFGSGLRDRAMILETLNILGDKNGASIMVKDISEEMSSNRWYNTQAVSYCLLAIGKFVGDNSIEGGLDFAYQLGNRQSVNAGSKRPMMQIEVPIDQSPDRKVRVKNSSKGVLFARLILQGQPVTGEETKAESQLKLVASFKNLNGKTIDPSSIQQGTDFIAEVKVTHPGTRPISFKELALDQIFPSGWEILNTRMDEVQNFTAANTATYQDFRDDRVYTFFNMDQGTTHIYRVQLNAAYQGRFYLPAVSCEAMYDNTIYAREPGQWVEVVGRGEI